MGIEKCLSTLVEAKEISSAEADDLNKRYEQFRGARAASGSPAADAEAKADLSADLKAEALDRKRRFLLQTAVDARIDADLDRFRTASGKKDKAEAALALLEHYGTAPYSSVEGRRKSLIGADLAKLSDLLAAFERDWKGGAPNKARLSNIVREAFGKDTGDRSAKAFVRAWLEVAEGERARFNRAGGSIGKLDNWGLPQVHDRLALTNIGKDRWATAILPRLNLDRISEIAGRRITREEMTGILGDIWEDVVTDGWASRDISRVAYGKGMLAKQRSEHRFLIFKSPDDWMAYQADFGGGADPFAAMMHHIGMMNRDIAAMEILGPNPDAQIRRLTNILTKAGQETKIGKGKDIAKGLVFSAETRAAQAAERLDEMWFAMRGGAGAPVSSGMAWAGATARGVITSSVMGKAVLSAVTTDPMFGAAARHMAGLPAFRSLSDTIGAMGKESRTEAVRMGLVLDSALNVLGTEARYAGAIGNAKLGNWLADRTLAWSGLNAWTQAGKHGFGMTMMMHLADQTSKGWKSADPTFRRTFERYGFTAEDWAKLATVKRYRPDAGGGFLRPDEIAAVDEQLAHRVLEVVLTETEYAVPSGTVRGRTYFVGRTRAGTAKGEFWRSAAMYKSFSVTFALLYGSRLIRTAYERGMVSAAAYAGAILFTSSVGGAAAMWLKDVTAGRDPRPIGSGTDAAKFLGAAALQGGGLGIWGDFLFSDLNRYGGSFGKTLAGPVAERGSGILNLTLGNLVQLGMGEDANFGREAVRFLSGNVPFANIWYARIGWERLFLDQVQHAVDPKANQSFKEAKHRWVRDFNTDFWWQPGKAAPDRMPAF
ncbi:MAG: uncharacterized protein H6Q99_326 [Proteobacteria bacterium]|nr:uncharacterized protein [Pseudomonadota bacterium]